MGRTARTHVAATLTNPTTVQLTQVSGPTTRLLFARDACRLPRAPKLARAAGIPAHRGGPFGAARPTGLLLTHDLVVLWEATAASLARGLLASQRANLRSPAHGCARLLAHPASVGGLIVRR